MNRSLLAFLALFLQIHMARSQDSPPEALVSAIKHATVFIQVEGSNWKGSGSGFVISVDKETALVATNYHVIAGASDRKSRPAPAEVAKMMKAAAVTVVFDSGTKSERSLKGQPIADADRDLATIRVAGLKEPPAPIDFAGRPN